MPPIVATVGSASANSYVTETEAGTIAGTFFPVPTTFAGADPEDRQRQLLEAMRILEAYRYKGSRADGTQALEWPRVGVSKPGGWSTYAGTEIPAGIKRAQVRLAVWLADHASEAGPAETGGLSSLSVGGEFALAFEAGQGAISELARFLADTVEGEMLGLFYLPQVRLVRG